MDSRFRGNDDGEKAAYAIALPHGAGPKRRYFSPKMVEQNKSRRSRESGLQALRAAAAGQSAFRLPRGCNSKDAAGYAIERRDI